MSKRLVVLTHFDSFCSLSQTQVSRKHIDVRYFIAEICD